MIHASDFSKFNKKTSTPGTVIPKISNKTISPHFAIIIFGAKMKRLRTCRVAVLICVSITFGCKVNDLPFNQRLTTDNTPCSAKTPTHGPSYLARSDAQLCPCDDEFNVDSLSPDDMIDYQNIQYWQISLNDCIRAALEHSEVFRNLGGTIVTSPNGISTAIDPALTYTNPTAGEEAALSAFDANFVTSAFFENNDRPFNNLFSGDTNGLFVQDLGEYRSEINKLTANGTLFTARSSINYDNNNQAGNRFPHSYESILDFGFRTPLLQGSGSLFNRIAGPSQTPGVYNGVLIARTNTEISLTEFEAAVRDLVSNVENAYWDLYYAYRELASQVDSRDVALRVLNNAIETGDRRSQLELASAKEQYLRFETAVVDSLEGRNIEGTQANSGSSGGTFRRTPGVRIAERRLRYLIGLAITDGRLLQPADLPISAPIKFSWEESVFQALAKRPETRRQRWIIKQRELELTAARNFLLPRFDLVGNYRFRGLGKDLTGGSVTLQDDINAGTANSSAFADLSSGNFQEVQLGAELRLPVGFRQGHAAVRNAQLAVQREKAILAEQEQKIVLDLSNVLSEVRRSWSAMSVAKERFSAAEEYFKYAEEAFKEGRAQIDIELEAQRRILEARLQFISAEAEYAIAIKNVHFERGTYLFYHGVELAESLSSSGAYDDFQRRFTNRNRTLNYVVKDAVVGSPTATAMNSVPQEVFVGDGSMMEGGGYPAIPNELGMPEANFAPTDANYFPADATFVPESVDYQNGVGSDAEEFP